MKPKNKYIIYLFIVFFSTINFKNIDSYASENIRVLILNDLFHELPQKGEELEKLGSLEGDLFLMGSKYSGNIVVWKGKNSLYLINELPLEEYVKDVVSVEVDKEWDIEALKAQAVVARTYAIYQKIMNSNSNSIYDIASSTIHQLYKGSNPNTRVSYAVTSTKGEILTYDGKPIEAFYHSTCGGVTEDPAEVFGKSYPYLKPVSGECNMSPYSQWERKFPIKELEKILNLPDINDITIKSYTVSKRVKQVDIKYRDGIKTMNATEFRKILGWDKLPSTNFKISLDNDSFIFEGKGYGHGVGLCQWCALRLAKEGKNYKEILSHFYPGTIIQLYEDLGF
jgi:stage II sporulation protein D